jgi:hypothetical protein
LSYQIDNSTYEAERERERARAVGASPYARGRARARAESFLPLGITTTPPPSWQEECTPLRTPRPYVKACGTGTLALAYGDRVIFGALTCGSWSCSSCRKVAAAQLLDRLRRGMESRPDLNRILVTLTIDPSKFDAVFVGLAYWDAAGNRTTKSKAQRTTKLWSGPNPAAFEEAAEAMSIEWRKLNDRLKSKARRAKVEAPGYFRVVELHRNGWPHYHVVIEHATWKAADIETQVRAWGLGTIVHAVDVSLDDAIGEVAPYLVSTEKGNGSKAYQFAALALPENFRLHSSSKGFLAPAHEPEELPERVVPAKGHFFSHHRAATEYGADSRITLNPPSKPDEPHKPPAAATATGDGSRLYFLTLLRQVDADLPPTPAIDLDDLPY